MTYYQECMFGEAVPIEIIPKYKPTQDEINEFYKTHTLLETVRHFHCSYNQIKVDPELKKGRHGAAINSFATELQVVFLKTFTKKSDSAVSRMVGVSNKTVAAIERRNQPLKNLFEEYMIQLGNACGEHLLKNKDILLTGMDTILAEALSRKKVKAADFKDLVDGWFKVYSSVVNYVPREGATQTGDVEAKNQLMDAVADAIKSDEMDKQTAESIYYKEEDEEDETT